MNKTLNTLLFATIITVSSQAYGLFRGVSKVTNGVLVPAERVTEKVLPPAEPIVRTPGYITRGVADVIEGYGFRITNKAKKNLTVTFIKADGTSHTKKIHHNDWVTLSYMPKEIRISYKSEVPQVGLVFNPDAYQGRPVSIRAILTQNHIEVTPSQGITEQEIQNAINLYQRLKE